MPAEVGPVQITYVANLKEALASFKEFGSSLKEVGNTARDSIAGIGESIGLFENLGTVLGGAFALKGFADFDRAVVNVRATLRQSSADFASTRSAILALATQFNTDATSVANGFNRVAKAGYDVAESQEVLTAAIKASKATGVDVAATTGVIAQTLKTYNIEASLAAETTGKLVAASQQGAFTFADLAGSIGTLGPSAARLGIGLDELLASLSSLSREQGNVEQVAAQLRSLFTQLLNPSAQVEAIFLRYLGTTARASIETRGFAETIKLLIDAAQRGDIALEDVFSNARELGAVLRIAGDGARSLNRDLNQIKDSGAKSLNEAVKIQGESLGDLFEDLARFPVNLVNQVFEENREAIVGSVSAFKEFTETNRDTLLSVAAVAAALPLVGAGLLAVKFSASTVVTLYDDLRKVFGLFASGSTAIAGLAGAGGAEAAAGIKAQLDALNALVPVRVRDVGVLDAWNQGLKAAAASQNALDLAVLTHAESLAALTAAEAEQLAVTTAAQAARAKSIASAQAAVAVAAEELAAARIAEATDATRGNARIAASVRLLAAEEALAAAQARATVATNAETLAQERVTAAKQAHAVAAAGVASATAAQTAASATSAATTAAAAAASTSIGATLKGLFPTFAGIGASLKDLPGLFAGMASTLKGFAANLTTVTGLLTLLKGGLAGIGAGIVSITSGLYAIATGVLGVLLAKLLLVLGAAYAFYKVGREIRALLSDNVSQAEIDEIEKKGAEASRRFAESRNQTLARRADEANSAANALKAKYAELAEAQAKASAGDLAAAERVKALREEVAKLEAVDPSAKLKASADAYAQIIGDSIDAAKKLGVEGAKDIQVQRDAYGRVVAIIGEYEKVLTSLGERLAANNEEANQQGGGVVRSAQEAANAADGYKRQREAQADLRKEQERSGAAARDLASAQSQLNLAVSSAGEVVKTYKDAIKRIGDGQTKAGLTEERRAVLDLSDEYRALTDIIGTLVSKRRELAEAQANAGVVDPAAESAIAGLDAQIKAATNSRRENERQTAEAIARDRLAAGRRVEEAEIAALQARGRFEEAEARRAVLLRNQQLAAAEAALAADLRGRDAIIKKAQEQLDADRRRIALTSDPQDIKAAGLSDAQKRYDQQVRLAKQLEAEALARYPREKQAVQDLYAAEAVEIERNRRKRFEATDEGRRLLEDVDRARRQTEALAEAAQIRDRIAAAQKRGDLRDESDLRDRLVAKLREAGDVTAANLERERLSRATIRDRLDLLRNELETRFRIGGLKGDFAGAARSAQQDLAGSSDAAGFRSGVRSKFGEDATEAAIEERRKAVIEALRREEQALALSKSQLNRADEDFNRKAAEIAERQKELLEKLRILNQEAERAKNEARNNRPVDDTQQRGTDAEKKLNQVGPSSAPTPQPSAPAPAPARPAVRTSDAPASITTPNFTPVEDRKKRTTPGSPAAPSSPSAPAPAAPADAPAPATQKPSRAPRISIKRRPKPGYVETSRYKVKDYFGGGEDRTIVVFTSLTTGAVDYIDAEDLEVDQPKVTPAPDAAPAPQTSKPELVGPPTSPGNPAAAPSPAGPGGIVDNLRTIGETAESLSSTASELYKSVDKFSAVINDGFATTDKTLKSIAARLDETAAKTSKAAESIRDTGRSQENARMGGG